MVVMRSSGVRSLPVGNVFFVKQCLRYSKILYPNLSIEPKRLPLNFSPPPESAASKNASNRSSRGDR